MRAVLAYWIKLDIVPYMSQLLVLTDTFAGTSSEAWEL